MCDLPRSALPTMPEGVLQGFPIELVVGHFLERIAGENELPAAWFLQPEQLA